MTRRMLAVLSVVVSLSGPSYADPVVTGVSGSPRNGEALVISGAGFGAKAAAAPTVFETFESGGFNPYWSNTTGLSIQTARQRSALSARNAHHNFKGGTSNDVHNAYMTGNNGLLSRTWYVSYWFYLDPNFNWQNGAYPNAPKFLSNVKFFRLWNPGTSLEDFHTETHGWDNKAVWYAENTGEPTHYYLPNYATTYFAPGTWHHLQFAFKESSGPGIADGRFQMWCDGAKLADSSTVVTKLKENVTMRPYNVGFYNSWSPGEGTPDASDVAPNDFYMDDAYVDTTWQRVELGDKATYDSCTHRELQPPSAWEDSRISVNVNLGSFSGSNVYLYVVDKDGKVNSPGFLLSGSGGSSDATPPVLAITSPTSGASYAAGSAATLALSGTASDDVGVAQVSWSSDRGGSGAASGTTAWSVAGVPLQDGGNVITVVARDAAGNAAVKTLTVQRNALGDAQAPTVALTAPVVGNPVFGNVTITASASDNVGVAGIQFKLNGAALGAEDTVPPYSLTLDSKLTANGAYTLTATARDAAGNSATSAAVKVTVANGVDATPPILAITSPTAGASYAAGAAATLAVSGTASDNVGVTQVSWSSDRGGSGAASGTAAWSVAGVPLLDGGNVITVTARDAAGNTAAKTLTVQRDPPRDAQAPTAALTSPAAGSTVSGNVTITASASDNVGVAGVQFKLNGAALGAEDIAPPYTLSLDSKRVVNGVYTLTATARDAAGNSATSAAVKVTVANGVDATPPILAITSPTAGASYAAGAAATLAVSGTASDNVGVTQVSWSSDRGGSGAASGTAAWSVAGVPLQDGGNVITVTARDAAGNTAAKTLTVQRDPPRDAQAPTAALTSPAAGSTVSGNVTITASASDNVGVAGVQFKLDGVPLGAEDAVPPYTLPWDTTSAADGLHTLTVTARDAAGNAATAAAITVDVLNAVQTVVSIDDSALGTGINQMNYAGSWGHCVGCATAGEYGGGNSWSNALNDALTVAFVGTRVSLYVVKDKHHGIAAVSVDNGAETPVDLYAPARQGNALAWTSAALTSGSHTFRLRVTKTKSASSGGTDIGVDRVDVTMSNAGPDRTSPSLTVSAPASAPAASLNARRTASLVGTAADDIGVVRVDWDNAQGDRGTAQGTTRWVIRDIPLYRGQNAVTVTAVDAAGNAVRRTVVIEGGQGDAASSAPPPAGKFLSANTPLEFDDAVLEVTVVNIRGMPIYTARREAGAAPIVWNGRDAQGALAESGVYICRGRSASGAVFHHAVALIK